MEKKLKFAIRIMDYMSAFEYVYNYGDGEEPEKRFAILSIQEAPQKKMGFRYKRGVGLKAALNICFSDVSDRDIANGLVLPDWHSMTLRDAKRIRRFVEGLIEKDEITELIIHCHAGISRSAAVAAALLRVYNGDDSEVFDSGRYAPNMRVYRLMLEAYGVRKEKGNGN